eukprot:m.8974 g.8974  ORF g.8974 m.8974 type:complete len:56 (+) comp3984_c0_seq1:42-209(+)
MQTVHVTRLLSNFNSIKLKKQPLPPKKKIEGGTNDGKCEAHASSLDVQFVTFGWC